MNDGGCRLTLAALVALIGAGCGPQDEPELPPGPAPSVVVYAAGTDDDGLDSLFADFTNAAGTRVVLRRGTVEEIAAAAVDAHVSPALDVLLTTSVGGVWQPAARGALRPLAAGAADYAVPAWARDPDGYWVGIAYRYAAALYHADVHSAKRTDEFAALAIPARRGQLCLSAFSESINAVIVANLIDRLGEREAELTVRGWIANLAAPPFATESALVAAVEAGRCRIGIAASSAFETAGTGLAVPARAHIDIAATGIGRHAANPAAAEALVQWMLDPQFQQDYAVWSGSYPMRETTAESTGRDFQAHGVTAVDNLARAGRRLDEARRLAERVGWR